MGGRQPLSLVEKEEIYQGKLAGKSLSEVAQAVGCSWNCARKWWRVGRKGGLAGLQAQRAHRGRRGPLSQFASEVIEQAKSIKEGHPGWGGDRVRDELTQQPELQGLPLPGRSSLTAFFKAVCPQSVGAYTRHPPSHRPSLQAQGVHEIWELDNQEKIPLTTGELVTVCSIRDPYGAAMIASQAFVVGSGSHFRKLDWTEIRGTLRAGFTEWHTLPDIVQTDNEMTSTRLKAADRLPSLLALWLVGLGIRHHAIRPRRPTDQAHIERNHRTLDGWTWNAEGLQDPAHFQQALDQERHYYNTTFPSRASDCQRQPPIEIHPDLLVPRRFYDPAQELALFDMQRVYEYLAGFWVRRKVSAWASISLLHQNYCLGLPRMRSRQLVYVLAHFDPLDLRWHIFLNDAPHEELMTFPLKGLDLTLLTDLEPLPRVLPEPLQLPLPFWLCEARGTIIPGL